MKCEIHSGSGNSLDNVANLHAIMAVDNCEFFEFFPCTGENKFGLIEGIKFDNGYVHVSSKPGLGYEIDWAQLRKKTLGTFE